MKKDDKLTFEASLKKLETLLEKMEQGEIPLSDLIANFEKGTQLINHCQKYLQEAELKIEVLKKEKSKLESVPYNAMKNAGLQNEDVPKKPL